ncbi:MAG: hypothetical protein SCK70_12055, partial [bacterium]|nr:hypothetical protein [bacterium]
MDLQRKKNLRALAKLMNRQNVTSIPVTDQLLDCFDAVITPEENDFLLKMGGERFNFAQACANTNLPIEQAREFLVCMLKKGLLWSEYDEGAEYF